MKKALLVLLAFVIFASCTSLTAAAKRSNPVSAMVERIDAGSSKKFIFELVDPASEQDYFELDNKGGKVWIKGNNWVSVSAGLNWYLKYHAGIQITWNNPKAYLWPLPKVKTPERHSTDKLLRYYLNYCTYSYSMWNWDWDRWQQEIDWMALHGVNMPLALVGTATVWRNTMVRLGFSKTEIDEYVAGPAHQAWWLMNNMQGYGGPNPNSWYDHQVDLEKKILARFEEFGIDPVFAGYSGMLPVGSNEKLGVDVTDPGKWCSLQRPAFLMPTDPKFAEIADIYYEEMKKLFGVAPYYSMDPFHEGGDPSKVDLQAAGQAIYDAMKRTNPGAKWVAQAWQDNPRAALIGQLPAGEVIVLDLYSEARPQWGDPNSMWYRPDGFGHHDWVYCLLLNFGGNVGMFGKIDRLIDGYYLAQEHKKGETLIGVGASMEGIENNPMMYELLYELPWRKDKFTKKEWLDGWVKARYGRTSPQTLKAWEILGNTAYEPPYESTQEGTTESVFCGRPALQIDKVSSWGGAKMYYDAKEFEKALTEMLAVAPQYRGNNNFEYDLVDIARQALANRGNTMLPEMERAFTAGDSLKFTALSDKFLEMILLQDQLLSSKRDFMLGPWIVLAMKMGKTKEEQDFYRQSARRLITTWAGHEGANKGGLSDYAHREWSGLLREFYYPRWKAFFEYINQNKQLPVGYDWFPMEEKWVFGKDPYPIYPTADAIEQAYRVEAFIKK